MSVRRAEMSVRRSEMSVRRGEMSVCRLLTAIEREEKTLSSYRDDIDRTRWLTSQHVERLAMGSDFVPPRIVVCTSSSNIITDDDASSNRTWRGITSARDDRIGLASNAIKHWFTNSSSLFCVDSAVSVFSSD